LPFEKQTEKNMKISSFMVLLAFATMVLSHAQQAPVTDAKLLSSIKAQVTANPSFVLQIVERAVRENPSAASEIVKTAIQATNADSQLIASIVEVVARFAPEQLNAAARGAAAVAPDSFEAVQAVLVKFDPAAAEAAMSNPLDFPAAEVATDENGGNSDGGNGGGNGGEDGGNGGDGGSSSSSVGFGSNSPGGNSPGGSTGSPLFGSGGQIVITPPKSTKNDN
jgi:hypothetical protein